MKIKIRRLVYPDGRVRWYWYNPHCNHSMAHYTWNRAYRMALNHAVRRC